MCFITDKKAVDSPKCHKYLATHAAAPVWKRRAAFNCYTFAWQLHCIDLTASILVTGTVPSVGSYDLFNFCYTKLSTPTQGNSLPSLACKKHKWKSSFCWKVGKGYDGQPSKSSPGCFLIKAPSVVFLPVRLNLRGSIHVLSFYFPTHGKPRWSCCVNTDSSSMQLLGRMSRLKRLDRLGWSRSGNCRCYFASPVDVIWTSVWWGEGEQRQLLSADQSRRLHVPFSAPCPSSLQFRFDWCSSVSLDAGSPRVVMHLQQGSCTSLAFMSAHRVA